MVRLLSPLQGWCSTLIERFENLACAVIRIDVEGSSGTGFFVNNTGRLITAAHVVYDKRWKLENNKIVYEVVPKKDAKLLHKDGSVSSIEIRQPDDAGKTKTGADLATIETGEASQCFIPMGDSDNLKVGQHLIAIGFPASNPTGVLYDGFLSARHTHLPIPIGRVEGHPDLAITARYEVLRVQMPITPGASGAPVIDEDNRVVGVMSEVPVILTNDIQAIIRAFGGNWP